MDNNELGISRKVFLEVNTSEESFNARITGEMSFTATDSAIVDSSDEEEEFSSITIYDEDDVIVEICGIEFDEFTEEVTISIWCSNNTDKEKHFWIKSLCVNGDLVESITNLGSLDENDSEYKEYVITNLEDIEYSEINHIRFRVEIDDEDDDAIDDSLPVSIELDTDKETFKVNIE